MTQAVAYDLTRLVLGPTLPVPRGIDRVDLGYARYFFESWPGECVGTLPLPLGLLGGVVVIKREAALKLLNLISQTWGESADPDKDAAFAFVKARLANPRSDYEQPAPPHHFRPHRIVTGLIAAVFRLGGFWGLRTRSAVPKGAVYVNTGQLGLAFPWLTGWLAKRPDVRRVFMLHDAIPLEFPEFVTAKATELHANMIANTARSADGLIVTTEAVRHSVLRELAARGRSGIATFAAPLPVSPVFLEQEPADPGLKDRRYFVICGSIEPRKNHLLLVNVWRRLAREGAEPPKLVIVGTPWRDTDTLLTMIAQSDVLRRSIILVSGLTSPSLRRLIRGAEAVLAPSFIEGFGLPLIEALALGTPVIASDLPAHREAGVGFGVYLDPVDGLGWEAAIRALLDNPGAARAALAGYTPWDWRQYSARIAPFLTAIAQMERDETADAAIRHMSEA